MITSTTIERREQTPDVGYDWLYRSIFRELDGQKEEIRTFTKRVMLGMYDTPYEQCTQADKDEWDNAHSRVEETYEQKVVRFIREKYNVNDEIAILRQRDSKPEEFAEYNSYCEDCKIRAKAETKNNLNL